MKKLFAAAAIATALLSVTAMNANAGPNTGIIKFSGAISSSTCNMNVAVDGVVSPSGVVDLGVYGVSDVTAAGAFGEIKNVSLVPETAGTAGAGCTPEGTNASLKIDAAQTDATNTSVVTSPETADTSVGVLFTMADDSPVVNVGAIPLTSGSANLDDTGAVFFKAQPFALAETVAPGIIGGSVSYVIAYL